MIPCQHIDFSKDILIEKEALPDFFEKISFFGFIVSGLILLGAGFVKSYKQHHGLLPTCLNMFIDGGSTPRLKFLFAVSQLLFLFTVTLHAIGKT